MLKQFPANCLSGFSFFFPFEKFCRTVNGCLYESESLVHFMHFRVYVVPLFFFLFLVLGFFFNAVVTERIDQKFKMEQDTEAACNRYFRFFP